MNVRPICAVSRSSLRRPVFRGRCPAFLPLFLLSALPLSAATAHLTSTSAGNRWRDVAGHLYAEAFRTNYTYASATVTVTYATGQSFAGHFSAQALKPNFAYQLKFEGRSEPLPLHSPSSSSIADALPPSVPLPGAPTAAIPAVSAPTRNFFAAFVHAVFAPAPTVVKAPGDIPGEHPSNALIGWHGRWWQETWNGVAWSSGANLNNKGSANGGLGQWPSPNDVVYVERRDIPEPTSPTGRLYRYMAYRPFEYFITDHAGDAEFDFRVDSTYHVLFKTTQRTPDSYDGRILTCTYSVDPALDPAYDTPLAETRVQVFGEWERLPIGHVPLLPGVYDCDIMLTEESFHGTDGAFSGSWAPAVRARIAFRILAAPTILKIR